MDSYTDYELLYLNRAVAEVSLYEFVKLLWHAVEPKTKFVEGWVVKAICDHLQAVSEGKIRRLLINVSPGCMKSLTTDVFFPAWEWGPRGLPSTRYVCVSYSAGLTERDNLRMQQLIFSETYQAMWGNRFRCQRPSVVKLLNNQTGWKLATSVGGIGTGERGDRLLIDDPNNVKETESKVVRESTNQWLREVMPTRLNSPTESAIICIQQRTHYEDASATLLATERNWCHLFVPMRYDPGRHCDTYLDDGTLFWSDPRTEEGELCWPERFPEEELDLLESDMTPYAVAGQHQQVPVPRGGAIIEFEWWRQYGPDDPIGMKFPPFSYVIAALDTAFTDKEQNDPSALVVLGVWTHPDSGYQQVMVIYSWSERLRIHELVQRVKGTCDKYRVDLLLMENKGGAHHVEQELSRLFYRTDWGVVFSDPTRQGDKEARVHSVAHLFKDGMIHCPNTSWGIALQEEVTIFPRGAHDDRVDALVMGLRYLRDLGLLSTSAEMRRNELGLQQYRSKAAERPLYAA